MSPIIALAPLCLAVTTVQQSGEQGIYQRSSIQQIESRLGMYLNGEGNQAMLTAGESVEWTLKLHAGNVVVADAESAAFDPALQIVDSSGKVLDYNDDRYPGDQRPLLFWRCGKDGDYKIAALSYKNKTGGQVSVRYNIYETLDVLEAGKFEQKSFSTTKPFLLRVPMQAGQVMDIVSDKMGRPGFINYQFRTTIYPNGLPEISAAFSEHLRPAINGLFAPLDGNYYVLYQPNANRVDSGNVRVMARDFAPKTLRGHGETQTAKSPGGTPAL
ncbi:MAG TPA: hypothetical protein VNI20_05255, partial [Fimbriimonadaceae bacterium]|nr:hypothetical protein [Fimbriimonadaceae bacterium]